MEMEPLYQPHGVEERWQQTWEAERLYHADPDDPGEAYVIAVPPPNVTGALHMGHALNGSIQDALIRWHRMRGFNTLWQPGFDHAGIATQAVVEKELRKQGTSRQELGREAFVERVWEWLHEYGGVIMSQFRRLGCSLDYERERFTMDDDYIRAVMRFFVHLYDRGWLFRDNRIINWCTDCQTSISDLEVEYIDLDESLTYARYPLVDGDGSITIATVRPATILADVASPCTRTTSATRSLIGKQVLVPVVERARADHRRRARRDRLRHRRAQDHAGPRPDRLRDRPRPRPARADRDRLRRPHDRRHPGGVRRPDRGRGRRQGRRVAEASTTSSRSARATATRSATASARSTRIQPLVIAAVVVRHEADGRARDRGDRVGPRDVPPARAQQGRARLAEGDPPVERVTPALVGPPAADLVLPGRPRDVRRDDARRVRRVRQAAS